GRVPQLDQLRTPGAGLLDAQGRERSVLDRDLVDAELGVRRQVTARRKRLAGLEVDDVVPALLVDTDAVHRAADRDRLAARHDLDTELVLGREGAPGVVTMPPREAHQGSMGLLPLSLTEPGGLVVEAMPHPVEPLGERIRVGVLA